MRMPGHERGLGKELHVLVLDLSESNGICRVMKVVVLPDVQLSDRKQYTFSWSFSDKVYFANLKYPTLRE